MDEKKKYKSIIYGAVLVLLCTLVIIGIVAVCDIKQQDVYGQTYYAMLPKMYEKLSSAKGKKIVIIGNSSVPFGVNAQLMERLLKESGHEYSVCNFGLYGSIGTRAMLDLAEECINEGDIVVFIPEHEAQSLSLYFSAKEFWYAAENSKYLINRLEKELRTELWANYPAFVADRIETGEPVVMTDVYSVSSFDDNLDLTLFERPYNTMSEGYDANNPINLDALIPSDDFFEYVNEFYKSITAKGAYMYYAYSPINQLALQGDAEAYCQRMKEGFAFPVIGNIEDSVLDFEWFYDSNFHMNDSGMTVFTKLLVDNLKTAWGDSSVTECSIPKKPSKEATAVEFAGDNSDEALFEYEEYKDGYKITGVTEDGAAKEQLILPGLHEGKNVYAIDKKALDEASSLKTVIIQENITSLPDYMFSKCTKLTKIVLRHTNPSDISVGYHLLAGVSAKVYVPESSKNTFKNNYFWGSYAEDIEGYEK